MVVVRVCLFVLLVRRVSAVPDRITEARLKCEDSEGKFICIGWIPAGSVEWFVQKVGQWATKAVRRTFGTSRRQRTSCWQSYSHFGDEPF